MATASPEQPKCAKLFKEIPDNIWPIVYSENYNISFMKLENLHPFDSKKWGNIYKYLEGEKMVTADTVVTPNKITKDQLLEFHTEDYLSSLRWSAKVAMITEVPPVACLPIYLVDRYLLEKLRLQTSGTILAAKLALERQWSINIGGGFHHCSSEAGGGFCAYADISGALKTLKSAGLINTALIIDLDAHQGNGHERDFMETDWVHTLDVFNSHIYPGDFTARGMRNLTAKLLRPYTGDEQYLQIVDQSLTEMETLLKDNKPDIIAYNAGTDVLKGDPLGMLAITEQGIIDRDEMVFRWAHKTDVPIFMVTSGGYQRVTAEIIAKSILNLHQKNLIRIGKAGPSSKVSAVSDHV